jgi:tetratricopeptide (TPR) repeat protein
MQKARLVEQLAIKTSRSGEKEARIWLNKALDAANSALQADSKNTNALFNRAVIFEILGRPTEALADIDRAIQHSPNDPRYHLEKAWILSKMNKNAEAKNALDQYLTLNPDGKSSALFKQVAKKVNY